MIVAGPGGEEASLALPNPLTESLIPPLHPPEKGTTGLPLISPSKLLLDDVINSVGVGAWTLLYFALATLIPMSMLVNLLVAEFTAVDVFFRCASVNPSIHTATLPELVFDLPDDVGISHDVVADAANDEGDQSSQCYLPTLDNSSDSGLPCTAFVYDNSTYATTITTEFDLVCEREWLRALFQLMFTLGCLAGAPVGGVLADRYGRRTALWWSCVALCLLTLLLTAVPVLEMVMVVRFLLGLFTDVAFIASVTLGMEVCPTRHRHVFGTVESLPYAVMLPTLAGIAYLCRRWRQVQLWASVPLLLATVMSCPLLLDESPRWLVSRGRLQDAEAVIRRAGRLNRTTERLPPHLTQVLGHTCKHCKTAGEAGEPLFSLLLSLVSSPEMRRITLTLSVLWFFEGALYISLPLSASSYESPFVYLALLGLLEVPGTVLVSPLGGRYGRKKVGCCCATITTVTMAGMAALRAGHVEEEWLLVTLAVVAYVALVGVSQMTLLLTSELFPTTVRSLGSSIGFLLNNVGYCVPPLLEMILPPQPWPTLLIYSLMAVLTTALLLLLPETGGKPLCETVAQHVSREREGKVSAGSRGTQA